MRLSSHPHLSTVLLALLCAVTIALSSVATYAWFAQNAKVEEKLNGMSAKVTPNLVISLSSTAITTLKADATGVTEVTATATQNQFTPATHYAKDAGGNPTVLPNLRCLSDYTTVNKVTGLSSSATLIDLPTTDGKCYFVDYTVYVASTDVAIENSCLTVTLAKIVKDPSDSLSWQAGSVDFYLGDTTAENFKGTLNLAGKDARINDGTTTKTTLQIDLPDDRIPRNSDAYLTLIMRIYFDGALLFIDDSTPRCYVNSQTVRADEIHFDVSISDTLLTD